jgi:hypothetical protein
MAGASGNHVIPCTGKDSISALISKDLVIALSRHNRLMASACCDAIIPSSS